MQQTQSLGQNGTQVRRVQDGTLPGNVAEMGKEIPYDYVARFVLEGKRGHRIQEVINTSVDGAFVAAYIGYSFIPPPLPDSLEPDPARTILNYYLPSHVKLFDHVAVALGLGSSVQAEADDIFAFAQCIVRRLCGIDFKYSIIDSSTGRELQNLPIHNIAGLGEPAGNRPFLPLPKPVLFMPRSTIRIEVEEISEGPLYGYEKDPTTKERVGAELYIVLQGYKILGYGTGAP